MRGPDRVRGRAKAISREQARQSRFDPANESGAGENERRIELYQAGARPDLCVGVLSTRDPADADQRQTPLGQAIYFGE